MVKETKQSLLTVRENQDSDERMKDVSNINKEVNFSSTIETIATMLFSDGLPQSPPSPAEVSNDDENDDNNDEYLHLHEKSINFYHQYLVCNNKNELIYMSSANSLIRVPQVIGRDQEDLKVDERNRRTK